MATEIYWIPFFFLIWKSYILIRHVPYLHNFKCFLHLCFHITVYLPNVCSDGLKLNNYWVKMFAWSSYLDIPQTIKCSWVGFSMEEQHCHLSLRNRNADTPQKLTLSWWNQMFYTSTDKEKSWNTSRYFDNVKTFFFLMLLLLKPYLFVCMLQAKKCSQQEYICKL